jgi:hypothetical protein
MMLACFRYFTLLLLSPSLSAGRAWDPAADRVAASVCEKGDLGSVSQALQRTPAPSKFTVFSADPAVLTELQKQFDLVTLRRGHNNLSVAIFLSTIGWPQKQTPPEFSHWQLECGFLPQCLNCNKPL